MDDKYNVFDDMGIDKETFSEIVKQDFLEMRNRPRTLVLNPPQVKELFSVYSKLKNLLDSSLAEYTIEIARQSALFPCYGSIVILTDTFGAAKDEMELFHDILERVYDIGIIPGIDNKIRIEISIPDVFIEILQEEEEE